MSLDDKEVLETLKQIAKNTAFKTGFQVILSDDKTNFNTLFNPKIELDKDKVYEIALVNLETYYSFPNIDDSNNIFVYSHDQGQTWTKIKIPIGSYEINDITRRLHYEMKKFGHYDEVNDEPFINFAANANTLKCILIVGKGYQVDFNQANNLSKVLGFTGQKYGEGFHRSNNPINILSINSILVNIDIIDGSYVNGKTKNTIYSFFPNVAPGYKIIESPVNLVYLPILPQTIQNINLTITDQDENLLNLRGEKITARFHIREAR